jgi:hypothetical protein
MKDPIEIFFRLIVGKGRIAYRKDIIRHLVELRAYHDKFGRDTSGFDEEIDRQQTKLEKLEGRC